MIMEQTAATRGMELGTEAIVIANNETIAEKFPKLKQEEIRKLTEDVTQYVVSVIHRLDSLQYSQHNIIERIEKIKDLKTEIKRKKTAQKWFHRDIGPIEETIIISNYYGEPLIEELYRLCDVCEKKLEEAYNTRSNKQKFNEIKLHILLTPVSLGSKTKSRYSNARQCIDVLMSEDDSDKLNDDLCQIKNDMDKIDHTRKITFWISGTLALSLFIFLSIQWQEEYSKNVLYIVASVCLSIFLYMCFFDIVMYIFKRKTFGKELRIAQENIPDEE